MHVVLWGGVGTRHRGSTWKSGQEQRQASPPMCWAAHGEDIRGWVLGSGCVLTLGAHGNVDTWVIFSPLTTPAPAQEAEPAPASTSVVQPEEPDAGADQEAVPDLEGCPPPAVTPPLSATPSAALEPGWSVQHLLI